MAKKNISNEEFIKEEKLIIEQSQDQIKEKEEEIRKLVESELIENKHIYAKLLQLENLIIGSDNLMFIHVDEWKGYIWNTCKFKEQCDENNMVTYACKQTKKPCHFIGCPENMKNKFELTTKK